jgi:hypothetical protein
MAKLVIIFIVIIFISFLLTKKYEGFSNSGSSCKNNLDCSSGTCLSTGPNNENIVGRFCL